jgi:crotonobetainyl-CoA:carnitine CoA-transferase CaiB-like acyl-CoA transferase
MAGALDGIRVVDFSEYIAGPYCTMMLADMGADVVKVERPEGDAWRHTAPLEPYEGRGFLGVNRGKRAVALDLARDTGREVARRLAATADVVVVNYRPGVASRLGLDYSSLSAANPGLIYCENTAFGSVGPYSGRPGFDLLSQATTGMILYENKLDRGTPSYIATVAVADLSAGMQMAFAIVSALFARLQSARGQHIETSLFAAGLAAQYRPLLSVEERDRPVREGFLQELAEARRNGATSQETIELRGQYVPLRGRNNYYRVYETRDGLLAVACLNNRQRRALRDLLGISDPTIEGTQYDWFSEEARRVHRESTSAMEESFRGRTTQQWLASLDNVDVPCAPVQFPEELFGDPHVEANGLIQTLNHPVLGDLKMPACPMSMSETAAGSNRPPPTLGQHNREVLGEIGYSTEEIDALFDSRTVVSRETLLTPA